ncbi:uncharacterized protein MELLADRAFT_84480 [Melampsora larici-populina 98AG31]|uniref:Acid phosphatase n=1 Tax=Melampsora larici-populina (strain 98AG31 / pathotype 3-4-7) TaxID=747676 RepID=F4SC54_MELLP|nr:uncharacterized protein MELLADRAFT_84480 [Melampsora larici-populina 98AG31]EGF97768.1 hypothetical protein MELLADRAFT_84480 [Melampsora larici-populina 98AG31]
MMINLKCLYVVILVFKTIDASIDPASYFPDQQTLGYAGPTEIGAEPSLIKSPFQPILQSHFPILNQNPTDSNATKIGSSASSSVVDDVNRLPRIYRWGNLSPMYSLPTKTFSNQIDSGPEIPCGCELEQVHLVHRHGGRYPTTGSALPSFGKRIKEAQDSRKLKAKGVLDFLNTWSYELGTEVLTPFGRSQMFDLGISYRQKYGYLLNKMKDRIPVFRTTTQDRMYHSALNFFAGFFGIPYEKSYHQSIIIESQNFNNSLAPYYQCPNSHHPGVGNLGSVVSEQWVESYLKNATHRFNELIEGYQFTPSDLHTMQQVCSYETIALGTSEFCSLFTDQEWLDYSYSIDLEFWYSNSFGNPTSAALGLGYTQELLARLTGRVDPNPSSSINTTLFNNPVTFPLNQSIYVDATHDTVISTIVVALNLTSLAASGPLPTNRRDPKRSFRVEQIAPFGAQMATQIMTCQLQPNSTQQKYARIVLNDAVIPLNGLSKCKSSNLGLCELDLFIESLQKRVQEIDYPQSCFNNFTKPVPINSLGLTNGRWI